MAVDLKIEIFAVDLFRQLWKEILYQDVFPELTTYTCDSLNDSECKTDHLTAVRLNYRMTLVIYRSAISNTYRVFSESTADFHQYVQDWCKMFNRCKVDIFSKIFGTAAVVYAMGKFCINKGNTVFQDVCPLSWAMFFDTELKAEFYANGGWDSLQERASAYCSSYEFSESHIDDLNNFDFMVGTFPKVIGHIRGRIIQCNFMDPSLEQTLESMERKFGYLMNSCGSLVVSRHNLQLAIGVIQHFNMLCNYKDADSNLSLCDNTMSSLLSQFARDMNLNCEVDNYFFREPTVNLDLTINSSKDVSDPTGDNVMSSRLSCDMDLVTPIESLDDTDDEYSVKFDEIDVYPPDHLDFQKEAYSNIYSYNLMEKINPKDTSYLSGGNISEEIDQEIETNANNEGVSGVNVSNSDQSENPFTYPLLSKLSSLQLKRKTKTPRQDQSIDFEALEQDFEQEIKSSFEKIQILSDSIDECQQTINNSNLSNDGKNTNLVTDDMSAFSINTFATFLRDAFPSPDENETVFDVENLTSSLNSAALKVFSETVHNISSQEQTNSNQSSAKIADQFKNGSKYDNSHSENIGIRAYQDLKDFSFESESSLDNRLSQLSSEKNVFDNGTNNIHALKFPSDCATHEEGTNGDIRSKIRENILSLLAGTEEPTTSAKLAQQVPIKKNFKAKNRLKSIKLRLDKSYKVKNKLSKNENSKKKTSVNSTEPSIKADSHSQNTLLKDNTSTGRLKSAKSLNYKASKVKNNLNKNGNSKKKFNSIPAESNIRADTLSNSALLNLNDESSSDDSSFDLHELNCEADSISDIMLNMMRSARNLQVPEAKILEPEPNGSQESIKETQDGSPSEKSPNERSGKSFENDQTSPYFRDKKKSRRHTRNLQQENDAETNEETVKSTSRKLLMVTKEESGHSTDLTSVDKDGAKSDHSQCVPNKNTQDENVTLKCSEQRNSGSKKSKKKSKKKIQRFISVGDEGDEIDRILPCMLVLGCKSSKD